MISYLTGLDTRLSTLPKCRGFWTWFGDESLLLSSAYLTGEEHTECGLLRDDALIMSSYIAATADPPERPFTNKGDRYAIKLT